MFARLFVPLAVFATCAPGAVLAQSWPAGAVVVASASGITAPGQGLVRAEIPATLRLPAGLPPTSPPERAAPAAPTPPGVTHLRPATRLAEVSGVPTVDIPAKAEWSDDQGLRFNWTKLAYKQRF